MFDYVGTLSEDRITVRKGLRWFHVFLSGERAYEGITFQEAGPFMNGEAWVCRVGRSYKIGYEGRPA